MGTARGNRIACLVVAGSSIAAGVVHLWAASLHLGAGLLVAGFVIAATAQIGIGVVAAFRRPRWWRIIVVAVHLTAILLWSSSRALGLGPVHGPEPIGLLDATAALLAGIAIVASLLAGRRPVESRRVPGAAVAVVAVSSVLLLAPFAVPAEPDSDVHAHRGGHHHPQEVVPGPG